MEDRGGEGRKARDRRETSERKVGAGRGRKVKLPGRGRTKKYYRVTRKKRHENEIEGKVAGSHGLGESETRKGALISISRKDAR